MSSFIVTCVHGTWARGSRWPELERSVVGALPKGGPIELRYFDWSGANSVKARVQASTELRRHLRQEMFRSPRSRHVLVAHSHGATVVLHALEGADETLRNAVTAVILLSPPLIDCKLVKDAVGASNKLLVGALAMAPLLAFAVFQARDSFGVRAPATLTTLAAVVVLWLLLFRPARVRARAQVLARELALPRVDVSGLVIRVRGDEATGALSSVGAFIRLARYAWSRILRARAPFYGETERHLRESRGLAAFVSAAATAALIPTSLEWLQWARDAVDAGNWLSATMLLPIAIVIAMGALMMVGGAVLLVLLLPALSLLLWPFGIAPTTAAALLSISVEEAPTRRWAVARLPATASGLASRWKHSTHCDPAALDAVSTFLGGIGRDAMSRRA